MQPKTIFPLLVVALVAGCSGPLEMHLTGQADMNNGGNAAVVRVYQLSGDTNFLNTPLASFWRDDAQALGNEMVTPPQEVLLYPNQTKMLELELVEATQYVGMAADLRSPEREAWRALYPVDELEGNTVQVSVAANQLQIDIE